MDTGRPHYRACRTPDGPLVTRHDPGRARPLVFPDVDYDWGTVNEGAVRLALQLITDATDGLGHMTYPEIVAEELLAGLPRDGWTLPCEELRDWLDRRAFDSEELLF